MPERMVWRKRLSLPLSLHKLDAINSQGHQVRVADRRLILSVEKQMTLGAPSWVVQARLLPRRKPQGAAR